jgi:rod shape-determining protein MreD
MTISGQRGALVIFFSIFIALVLAILPIPETMQSYRLQWSTLVLIYWCLAIPERVGVGLSFLTGIMLDIITGSLLGQHAMSLSIIAFVTVKTHQRIRVFPPWQQALFVIALLLLDRMLQVWVDGAIGRPDKDIGFWVAPLLGGVLWPWLFIIMRDLRRRFHVS